MPIASTETPIAPLTESDAAAASAPIADPTATAAVNEFDAFLAQDDADIPADSAETASTDISSEPAKAAEAAPKAPDADSALNEAIDPVDSADAKTLRKMLRAAEKKTASALKTKADTEAQIYEAFKKDPVGFAAKTPGFDLTDFLQKFAGTQTDPGNDPENPVNKRIQALEAEVRASASRAEAQRLQQLAVAAVDEVKASPDYVRINRTNNHSLVLSVMDDYFTEHGKYPAVSTAAKHVEKYLADLAGDPATPATTAKPSTSSAKPKTQGATTLTNHNNAAATAPKEDEFFGKDGQPDLMKILDALEQRQSA